MSHPSNSLDVELRGLFWAAVACAVAHAHQCSHGAPIFEVTKFFFVGLAAVCVHAEGK